MFPPSISSFSMIPQSLIRNMLTPDRGLEDEMVQEALRRSIEETNILNPTRSSPVTQQSEEQLKEMSKREAELEENRQLQTALNLSLLEAEQQRSEEERKIKQAIEESERLERQKLREEQERLYQESLERDRAKQRQREEEMRRQREEEEKKEREEEQRELYQALNLSMQLTAERERIQQLKERLTKLPPEPSPTSADTIQLVVRLPNGQRLTRNFSNCATFAQVKDWIDTLVVSPETSDEIKKNIPTSYVFVQDFPRKIFSDLNQTLKDAGLIKRALINVLEITPTTK
jgi:chemotaxis protein histidine kinase CheA